MFSDSVTLDERMSDMTSRDGNMFFVGDDSLHPSDDEDVSEYVIEGIITGKRFDSGLAWADFIRNTYVFADLAECEPYALLDVGCGNHHPMGRMIEGYGLDTHYIGLDASGARAASVTKDLRLRRPAVGLWHDAASGLPLENATIDYVICLEAMEHFCDKHSDVSQFFGEVARVLQKRGRFVLATPNPENGPVLHPHCHEHEFTAEQVLASAGAASLKCHTKFNYRAKGGIVREILSSDAEEKQGRYAGMPWKFIIPLELMEMTKGKLVPGNVIYVFDKE